MTFSNGLSTCSILIERLRTGDEDAYRELLNWIGPLVLRWCRKFGLSVCDAEEVFQESLFSVFQNLHRFERSPGQGGFRAWLWTIVHNKSIDLVRKTGMKSLGSNADFLSVERMPEPDDLERNELLWTVCRLVRPQFTETSWQVFWNTTVEGRSSADVAEDLGMSTSAVRKAKSRVLSAIRSELAIWEGKRSAEPDSG